MKNNLARAFVGTDKKGYLFQDSVELNYNYFLVM